MGWSVGDETGMIVSSGAVEGVGLGLEVDGNMAGEDLNVAVEEVFAPTAEKEDSVLLVVAVVEQGTTVVCVIVDSVV